MQAYVPFAVRYFGTDPDTFPELIDRNGESHEDLLIVGGVLVLDVPTIERLLRSMQQAEAVEGLEAARTRWKMRTLLALETSIDDDIEQRFNQILKMPLDEQHLFMNEALYGSPMANLLGESSDLRKALEQRYSHPDTPEAWFLRENGRGSLILYMEWPFERWGEPRGKAEAHFKPKMTLERLTALRKALLSGAIVSGGTVKMPDKPTY